MLKYLYNNNLMIEIAFHWEIRKKIPLKYCMKTVSEQNRNVHVLKCKIK